MHDQGTYPDTSREIGKRLLDLVVSSVGLLLLSPLLLLIALVIKLDTPGPVFFRQWRIGRHGVPFRIFKYRTMRTSAGNDGPLITVDGDRRVTRAGRYLRRYKLDELAQLIDVLRGTMSLVGPRPEVPRYVASFPHEHRALILSVRPGITDPASVAFADEAELLRRSDDPERTYIENILPRKLELSAEYIRNSSMTADIRLIARTVFMMQPTRTRR